MNFLKVGVIKPWFGALFVIKCGGSFIMNIMIHVIVGCKSNGKNQI
jgi:hypothetical protein